MALPVGAGDNLMSKEQLAPIVESLENIAAKKELRTPKSAYQCFMTEKLQAGRLGKSGGCKSFKEAAVLWKSLSEKQKEPFVKLHSDAKAKSAAVKKEWGDAFDKHWDDLEKHLEAEELVKEESIKRRLSTQKAKAVAAKKFRADSLKKKQKGMRRVVPSGKASTPARPAGRQRLGSAPASSASIIADKMRGLDTSVWEVRESTNRPGFFYYLNKKTHQTFAERPKSTRSAADAVGTTPGKRGR